MSATKEAELKSGEPEGGAKAQYASGKIAELLLELHEKDRPHVLEELNKLGILSGGASKYEKEREKEREAAVKASDEWVAQVKKDQETPIKKDEPKNHEPKGAKK